MKRILLLAVVLGAFATSAFAAPWPCDCIGGYNPYTTPTFWYLLDYFGNPLEDGDCVCAYWVGPDGIPDGPDPANPPAPLGDDVEVGCSMIGYGGFYFSVTTWGLDATGNPEGHPAIGEFIYTVIFDAPCDQIGPSNYYGISNLHEVQNFLGEIAYFAFTGDPGGGYTDIHVPVELTSFDAIARDGEVLLEWKTATETNALGFYVERGDVRSDLIQAAGNSDVENIYTYVDKNLDNGVTYSYNLITVDMDGKEVVANAEPVSATPMAHVPTAFALHQNYPNPFNPVTEIKYDVPKNTHVTLKVYNVLGAEVATLVDGDQKANFYTVSWDAKDLASGVYFCTLTAGDFKAVKKMVLLK
jgi:hypothetical protein